MNLRDLAYAVSLAAGGANSPAPPLIRWWFPSNWAPIDTIALTYNLLIVR